MHRRLVHADGAEQFAVAISEILRWGGLPGLSADAVRRVFDSLPGLDGLAAGGAEPPAALYAQRIASVSKLYAMHSPTQWVIYDSRLARGLALVVRQVLGPTPVLSFLRLPQPPGRRGGRPAGFPALSSSERQARLGFIYASWFSQDLAKQIRRPCPDTDGWDARHVEMALCSGDQTATP